MGLRLIKVIAAVSLTTACAKTTVPETVGGSDEIVVSIADSQFNTKCILDGLTPVFTFGDTIKVYDANNVQALYVYKSKQSANSGEKYVFKKVYGSGGTIDTTKICKACFPQSASYGNMGFSCLFTTEQKYATINGMQKISAPMACSELINKELVFSNIACLLKIGISCSSELDNTIAIDTIKVTSKISPIGESTYGETPFGAMLSGTMTSTYLVGCKSAGAVSSTKITYFYIILPPIFDIAFPQITDDKFTIEVVLDNKGSLSPYTFTATKGEDHNQITKNTIIEFKEPITITPEDLL